MQFLDSQQKCLCGNPLPRHFLSANCCIFLSAIRTEAKHMQFKQQVEAFVPLEGLPVEAVICSIELSLVAVGNQLPALLFTTFELHLVTNKLWPVIFSNVRTNILKSFVSQL